MQKYQTELKLIGNCNRRTQRALFQHTHGDFIRAIVDAIWTTLEGKLSLKPEQLSNVGKNLFFNELHQKSNDTATAKTSL